MIKMKLNRQLAAEPKQISFLKKLIDISINGLNDLYIEDDLEFAEKKKLIHNKIIIEGKNTRYTLINLLGLFKAESHSLNISRQANIDLNKIIKTQINNVHKYTSAGDIGLLLWATSLISPEDIPSILTKVKFNSILKDYKDTRSKITMEISWLLTGTLIASTFSETFKKSIGNLPEKLYSILKNNYGGKGIFKHQCTSTLLGNLRGNISSFADQVYPIYALVLYSKMNNNKEALLFAKECSLKICEHQGKNGEWMWHYCAKTGKVTSQYPFYSVHQDAMAPIALYAIQKATGINFEDNIFKGLEWLTKNTLHADMISQEHNAIWRAIGPKGLYRKVRSLFTHVGININDEYKNLDVLKESWSYHLGWLLFAFAGRVYNSELIENKQDNFKIYNLKKVN